MQETVASVPVSFVLTGNKAYPEPFRVCPHLVFPKQQNATGGTSLGFSVFKPCVPHTGAGRRETRPAHTLALPLTAGETKEPTHASVSSPPRTLGALSPSPAHPRLTVTLRSGSQPVQGPSGPFLLSLGPLSLSSSRLPSFFLKPARPPATGAAGRRGHGRCPLYGQAGRSPAGPRENSLFRPSRPIQATSCSNQKDAGRKHLQPSHLPP